MDEFFRFSLFVSGLSIGFFLGAAWVIVCRNIDNDIANEKESLDEHENFPN